MATPAPHRWRFSRVGGFDQPRFDGAADLAHLGELDQKLWAALACPVKGLEFDERTLALIDTDGDGRVRAPEIVAAVRWTGERLKDLGVLAAGGDVLALAQIDEATEPGRTLLACARHLLAGLGKETAASVSLADVLDTERLFAQTRFNGDGIVPPEAAGDEATRKVLEDVLACRGGRPDRGGKPGVDQETLDLFFAELAAFAAWAAAPDADPALAPFGAATAAAAAALRAVRAKVDDWFARSRLAAFDPRALAAVNRKEEDYLAAAAGNLSADAQEMGGFPLARVEAGGALPLVHGVNPAWASAVAALSASVVTPLFGPQTSLTAGQWAVVVAKLAPHEAWRAAKPATSVEKLGLARVREILASSAKDETARLVAQDKAPAREFEDVAQLERLIRYHRDLWRLLHNFVNFADFYDADRRAVFEAGTLYLDARSCELVVRVDDASRHALLAGMSKCCLAYCDCTRPSGEKLTIAAAFTAGDSDYLMVGRNGLFYDRQGRDWDATITRIVENPISVRQAFWSPYKKLVRMMQEFAAKRAAAADAEADARMAAAATAAVHADRPPEKPPEPPKKIDIGTVAAMAVAFGAIGTVVVGLSGIFKLPFWQICLALAGLVLLVSGPSMLIAWLKLRQRNLGPILDANGWAVNARVKMNVKFGGSLTASAELPPGSLPAGADPFAERRSPWPRIALFLVFLGFVWSLLDDHGWIWEWSDHRFGTDPATKKEEAEKSAEKEKEKPK